MILAYVGVPVRASVDCQHAGRVSGQPPPPYNSPSERERGAGGVGGGSGGPHAVDTIYYVCTTHALRSAQARCACHRRRRPPVHMGGLGRRSNHREEDTSVPIMNPRVFCICMRVCGASAAAVATPLRQAKVGLPSPTHCTVCKTAEVVQAQSPIQV